MTTSVSTRNLNTDSVLDIADPKSDAQCHERSNNLLKIGLIFLAFVCVGLLAAVIHLGTTSCKPDLVEVKIPGADQKYTMVKLEKTFDDAHEYCNSTGGDLASFSSMEEWLDFAGKLFFLSSADGWAKPIWLGARGNGVDGLRWTDGTPFVFNTTQHSGVSPWFAKESNMQPNNGFGEGICVYVYVGNGRKPPHSWLDYNCPTAAWFLCHEPVE